MIRKQPELIIVLSSNPETLRMLRVIFKTTYTKEFITLEPVLVDASVMNQMNQLNKVEVVIQEALAREQNVRLFFGSQLSISGLSWTGFVLWAQERGVPAGRMICFVHRGHTGSVPGLQYIFDLSEENIKEAVGASM
ncbi:hypothetical protein KBC40_02915 [Patescibacteria group bacterium]|nr:hypothetical protein [Patescibacteria group bacterium]